MINMTYLVVGGEWASELHRYVLRWVDAPGSAQAGSGGPTPVLYHDGKRVTKEWSLALTAKMAQDECGGNANTD